MAGLPLSETVGAYVLRPAAPPEAYLYPQAAEPDPRTARARVAEFIELGAASTLIQVSVAAEAASGLVRGLRLSSNVEPWTASIDPGERTGPPTVIEAWQRARERVILGNALGRMVRAAGTYDFLEATQPGRPDAQVEIFVAPPRANDPLTKARRQVSDALNGVRFADKDGDKVTETAISYGPYADNDVRFLTVIHHAGDAKNPPRTDPAAALRMAGPVTYRTWYGGKKVRTPHSVLELTSAFGVDYEKSLRATRFPDGSGLPEDLQEFYANTWDITLTSMDDSLAQRGGRVDVRVQMAQYKAALAYIRAEARRTGNRHTQYIIGVMDVDVIYESLHSRGPEDWVEAAGVVRQTAMSRKPGSNISTFAIGRVSSEDPADNNHWEAHMRTGESRWWRYFFGDELEAKRRVAITGLDIVPRRLARAELRAMRAARKQKPPVQRPPVRPF
ncbi:MAG TPA: hypothetical protein VLF71_02360 [Candidatus Saccharimonadales bacterium]|nr:hypothetical protein [Candidatus Saccharimonadales bacterium]